ncbi:hypothetical protein JJD41_21060 [Oxynema sp. CENA135]|uniref:hypothetical protein n=1 Tax=Oxynema sp. CENA135 TaxID=984206 RepID=UPI00190D5D66|nr:hypothetical protein [Oxynema sp. CENA135]MBK4732336.1 hypothetical protein [Oxynema sp. CENA135]
MSIPIILDLAISLIFIYLIVSLLASEIQEIITTLLQWRAEHLKKSIEVLLAGSSERTKSKEVQELADRLYAHPLINNLNQEAVGVLAMGFRKVSQTFGTAYHKLTGTQSVFGNEKSGPSYIPASNFAATLMDTLKISDIAHVITEERLDEYKHQNLKELVSIFKHANFTESSRSSLERELKLLGRSFDKIVADFKEDRISLSIALDSMDRKLQLFIENCQVFLPQEGPQGEWFLMQVRQFHREHYGDLEKQVIFNQLKPSASQTIDIIRRKQAGYEQIVQSLQDRDSATYQGIESLVDSLPESLKESLGTLAKRVRTENADVAQEMAQLQSEIETWFDRSMDRATGVYKRNARGIAILIGIVVAVIANADTLYIISNLSKDSVLRATVTQYSDSLIEQNLRTASWPAGNLSNPTAPPPGQAPGARGVPAGSGGNPSESMPTAQTGLTPQTIDQIKRDVRQSLDDISLPLGWGQYNVEQQLTDEQKWPVPYIRRVLGWIISGLAISMGSSFWFDLLSKVVNIRNAGKPSFPPSNNSR